VTCASGQTPASASTAICCPRCGCPMTTYERSGVVLDQCRECRGIYLDRGELEKLVEAEGGAWLGPVPGSDRTSSLQDSHRAGEPIARPVEAAALARPRIQGQWRELSGRPED